VNSLGDSDDKEVAVVGDTVSSSSVVSSFIAPRVISFSVSCFISTSAEELGRDAKDISIPFGCKTKGFFCKRCVSDSLLGDVGCPFGADDGSNE
jgi:hypothetical protein